MRKDDIVMDPAYGNKAEAFEAFDDIPTNPNLGNTISDVIQRRYGRRDFLRGSLAVTATTTLFGATALTAPGRAQAATAALSSTSWPGATTSTTTSPTATMPTSWCAGAI